ncbi:heparinase II/III domain-containing protein [Coraliomargarita sp. W4R72]
MMKTTSLVGLILLMLSFGTLRAVEFGARLDQLTPFLSDPTVEAILSQAEVIASGPIMIRVDSVEEMAGVDGFRVGDARAKYDAMLRNGMKWEMPDEELPSWAERFALASSDTGTARRMLDELPLLAASIRLTGSASCQEYLVRQLREVVTWVPFQRPGWTIAHRSDPLPAEGDGVWLSTGALLQALAIMDEILPAGVLPDDLAVAVRTRVAEEVQLSYDDWMAERSWYVKKGAFNSNQWVVPASGMVIGATMLGREEYADAYQLGVSCLRQSMTVVGDDGSMSEGYTYAMTWTSLSLFLASHFMESAGDVEFVEAPFFENFPEYLALYFQPGSNYVNVSDAFPAQRGFVGGARTEVTSIAALSGSRALARVVLEVMGSPKQSLWGLLVMENYLNQTEVEWPALWGLFERTRAFIWRSSWADDATGVWVRGGDDEDFHDNYDRGHVNFIVDGLPILIEAGTPGYALPEKKAEYDSALGHNVLRVDGETFPLKAEAAITVERADTSGGEVSVDLNKAYPKLSEYVRSVAWSLHGMLVTDELKSAETTPVEIQATWHFASEETPFIERPDSKTAIVHLPAGEIVFPGWIGPWGTQDGLLPEADDVLKTAEVKVIIEADHAFELKSSQRKDHTLKFRKYKFEHSTLELNSLEALTSLHMTTRFIVTPRELEDSSL